MVNANTVMSAKDAASYKARKEAFVSNLSGSSLMDINLVTLVAPAGILLWTALQKRQSFFSPNDTLSLIADYLINVCAILFALTVYSSAPVLLNVLLIAPACILLLPLLPESKSSKSTGKKRGGGAGAVNDKKSRATSTSPVPSRPFLTNYRGAMMLETCVAILAVDFPVFPRRFAKVETWGTSLMDLGVGSFVFSAGVVSARQLLSGTTATSSRPFHQRLITSFRHSIPLLVLGLIRLYSVKGLDYAEHVTEYGVHWNFFFTLGFLPPFVELADSVIQVVFRSYDILAILIAITYEIVLDNTDLLSYILVSPRGPSLLSKNREGVFSFIGYFAIFLFGRSTGQRILPLQEPIPKVSKHFDTSAFVRRERLKVMKNLVVQSTVYIALFAFITSLWTFNLNVSRRLANAPYVFWIAAYNSAQLLLCAFIEHVGPDFVYPQFLQTTVSAASTAAAAADTTPTPTPTTVTSKILQSFNKNGLPVFLIANLLTGLVNLTFNTLDASNFVAMAVLMGYAALVSAVALGLEWSGLKIRL